MKKLFYSLAAIIITATVLISITSFKKLNTSRIAKSPIATKGFVVMELFTSQGCSSCPAADEILGNYAKTDDGNIFPISFHVDYWNRLGWVDSFSNPAYTLRQNEYASKFNLESIYTPQLIINGQKELVGSDVEKIATLVASALNERPKTSISITHQQLDNGKISVEYKVGAQLPGISCIGVLIQNKVTTKIKAGENRGRSLINYNVVRDLTKGQLSGLNGNCILNLPPGNDVSTFQVVLFLQENESGKIIAATRQNL